MGSKPSRQRHRSPLTEARGGRGGGVPAPLDVVRRAGRALDAPVATHLGAQLGHDFSRVRLHTDTAAADSARAAGALAYTVGNHIVFGEGRFEPGSDRAQRMLAHELAHVAQQGGREPSAVEGVLVPPGAASEAEADRAAEAVVQGRSVPTLGRVAGPAMQRAPVPGAPVKPLLPGLDLPVASVEIGAYEAISKENPKLIKVAEQAAQGGGGLGPSRRVELSAYLTEGAKSSSALEERQRAGLLGRMHKIRDALGALGVPADRVDVQTPHGFSRSAQGEVSVNVRAPGAGLVTQGSPSPLLGPQPGPQPPSKTPALEDLLTVKFGPITVALPKSVKARLPVALAAGKTLVISLSADLPAKFSMSLTLDGTPVVRVSLTAGGEYDTDKKTVTGSAGLKIETVSTVCKATGAEETRSKITAAGEKLKKAAAEWAEATDSETKVKKLAGVAGAIAEMYDAVEKAKAGCKQVPRATFELGVKGPLGRRDEPDARTPDSYGGVTITVPF